MSAFRSFVSASILGTLLAASACVANAGDPQGEPTGTTKEDLTLVSYVPPPKPLPYPPAGATYCPVNPMQQLNPWARPAPKCSPATTDTNPATRDLMVPYGCSEMQVENILTYPGATVRHFALCPDTLAVRAKVAELGWNVETTLCDACVPHAPAGFLYVGYAWSFFPGCEGGCRKTLSNSVDGG